MCLYLKIIIKCGCGILAIIAIIAVYTYLSPKVNHDNLSNASSDSINKITKSEINKETEEEKVVENFINAVKTNDAEDLKQIISPSGLIVIRNFSSGNGTRGKDIRDLYLADNIPTNLEFVVSGESPIVLKNLLRESLKNKVESIPVEKINDNFNFKDNSKNSTIEPSTDDVRDICSEITSANDKNNQCAPKIFSLGDKEIALTESALVADSPAGAWIVFEKINKRYFLRAIIDLV